MTLTGLLKVYDAATSLDRFTQQSRIVRGPSRDESEALHAVCNGRHVRERFVKLHAVLVGGLPLEIGKFRSSGSCVYITLILVRHIWVTSRCEATNEYPRWFRRVYNNAPDAPPPMNHPSTMWQSLAEGHSLPSICTAWYHPMPRRGQPHPTRMTSAWSFEGVAIVITISSREEVKNYELSTHQHR